jgi:hypothetical protein
MIIVCFFVFFGFFVMYCKYFFNRSLINIRLASILAQRPQNVTVQFELGGQLEGSQPLEPVLCVRHASITVAYILDLG